MEWANSIFSFENRSSPSEFIRRIWRTRGVADKAMISVATPYWRIIIVNHSRGPTMVVARGPETRASIVEIPQGADFIGIEFEMGTFMPDLATQSLVDVGREFDAASKSRIKLAGSSWEVPTYENAADFVAALARRGALVRDPVVGQTLLREPVAITERSVQRRFVRATGLTYGTIRQIERAGRAAELLAAGTFIHRAVEIAGYSDQAHMTRSLRRFLGKTPGKLISDDT